MTWIYRRILNKIWMHIHSTIIHRCVIVRIRPEPWSNRPTKWIWHKSIITLLNTRSRLLTMLRWWICIFSLIWSLLLFLSSSFLLILGQELLETRPLLFVVSGIFFRNPRWTGRTGQETGLTGRSGSSGKNSRNNKEKERPSFKELLAKYEKKKVIQKQRGRPDKAKDTKPSSSQEQSSLSQGNSFNGPIAPWL